MCVLPREDCLSSIPWLVCVCVCFWGGCFILFCFKGLPLIHFSMSIAVTLAQIMFSHLTITFSYIFSLSLYLLFHFYLLYFRFFFLFSPSKFSYSIQTFRSHLNLLRNINQSHQHGGNVSRHVSIGNTAFMFIFLRKMECVFYFLDFFKFSFDSELFDLHQPSSFGAEIKVVFPGDRKH